MPSYPSDPFFESGAMACLIFYRTNGLHGSITCLHNMIRPYLPVVRINAILISKDFTRVIQMFDTKLDSRRTTRISNPERGAPFVESEKINQPVLINNLDGYKVQAPFKDPDLADVPFLIHSAMIRLPLFENGEYYFCLNFWSDDYDAFTWTHVEQLQRLVRPLAGELRERLSFTEEKALPYTPAGSGFERLSLCPELAEVRQRIELAAPTRTTVLILGETGSGKESVADAIHERSDRRNGPFLKVNCGAITPSLLSSELFGHEKGAFTGAHTTRRGYFEQANGGTLFLDEIGEMPQEAQVHLLRVLESRYVTRVGDHRPIPVDVRVIAATQTDLMKKVREGTFRKDLWFRLAVLTIVIPPLRDRKADIPALVRHFLRTKAAQFEMEVPDVPAPELERLYSHDWPGNVRELEFFIERSLLLSRSKAVGTPLKFEFAPEVEGGAASPEDGWPSLAELEQRYIRRVLEKTGNKLMGPGSATELLGVHYTTLRAHMLKMGLPLPRRKGGR